MVACLIYSPILEFDYRKYLKYLHLWVNILVIKPLVFSFVPRCHGACGSGKYTLVPFNSSVIRLCWENSFPLSGVTVLHLSSPTFLSRLIIQSTTFLEIFFSTLPSRKKRDLRSTRVTIRALPVLPATVSASQ